MGDLTVESYEDGGAMPLEFMLTCFLSGNYARGSWMFESGFRGFIGLTITSLIWVGRLLLNGAFFATFFAEVLHIGEKRCKK
jgi:hypothetical protein